MPDGVLQLDYFTGSIRALTRRRSLLSGSLTVRVSASNLSYGLPSTQTLLRRTLPLGKISGETRRIFRLKPFGIGLKYKSSGCFVIQQVRVHLRQIGQLEGMVAAHRVAALQTLSAHQVRNAVGQHVEINRAIVMIQEESIVERG